MKRYNMGQKLINTIKQLYANANSTVIIQGAVGDWFHTSVGVCQGCLLSPTLFNIFLEHIMTEALQGHQGTISIRGCNITNLRFADDIENDSSEKELVNLVKCLAETSPKYDMEISAEKTKLMTNSTDPIQTKITVGGQQLEQVTQLKYLGASSAKKGLSRKCWQEQPGLQVLLQD